MARVKEVTVKDGKVIVKFEELDREWVIDEQEEKWLNKALKLVEALKEG